MKNTLLFLLQSIVDHPDDARVDENRDESRTLLTINVHSEDTGRVIGKSGRIIKALRDLIKLMATKENTYVDVVLAADEKVPEEST